MKKLNVLSIALVIIFVVAIHNACQDRHSKTIQDEKPAAASDGPADTLKPKPHRLGDVALGKEVFRFETFGNEGFWFKAIRWQQGVIDSKFTPKQMLGIGLQIDTEAEELDRELRQKLVAEFKTDLSTQQAPLLNDVKTTIALLNAKT